MQNDLMEMETEKAKFEVLKGEYSTAFDGNPDALAEALLLMTGMSVAQQIHALTVCLDRGLELVELEVELRYWKRGFKTTQEELVEFRARYAELFGERALLTGEKVLEGMDESTKAHAFQFATMTNQKFEDCLELLNQWSWTLNLTTTTFMTMMDRQEQFETDLKAIADEAGIALAKRLRPLLGSVEEMGKTVQRLALSATDIEHSTKALSEAAYKEFKAKVNPEELKRVLLEGAGAKLSSQIVDNIKFAVKEEFKRRHYITNTFMLAFFCAGLFLGKYII